MKHVIFFVLIVLTCNVPFEMVIDNINLWLLISLFGFLCIGFVYDLAKGNVRSFSAHVTFLILMSIINFMKTALRHSALVAFVGVASYILIFLFWYLFWRKYSISISIDVYIKWIIIIAIIVSIFGIYQLVDPTLFGVMDKFSLYNTEYVRDVVSLYRVTSFMSSIQVYSVMVGVGLCLLLEQYDSLEMKSKWKNIGIFILALGVILSGSKAAFLPVSIVCLVKLFRMIFSNSKYKIYNVITTIIVSFVVFCCILLYFYEFVQKYLDRIFLIFKDFDAFKQQEFYRMSIMKQVFKENAKDILLGRGLGTSFNEVQNFLNIDMNRKTLESTFFSIWYECGFVTFVVYLGIMIRSIVNAYRYDGCFISLFSVMLIGFSSPALWSLSVLSIWGIVIYYAFYNDFKTFYKNKEVNYVRKNIS